MTRGGTIVTKPRVLPWLLAAVVLAVLIGLLTAAVSGNEIHSQDQTVLKRISTWSYPIMTGLFARIDDLAGRVSVATLGLLTVAVLWLTGRRRAAVGFLAAGVTVGLVMVVVDVVMGEVVTRPGPLVTSGGFPSGHVVGTTVLCGFWGFFAVRHGLRSRILIPIISLLLVIALAAGFARMLESAHWPSDVAGGYLLGGVATGGVDPTVLVCGAKARLASD